MGKGLFTFHYHIEDVIVFVDYSILRVRRLQCIITRASLDHSIWRLSVLQRTAVTGAEYWPT